MGANSSKNQSTFGALREQIQNQDDGESLHHHQTQKTTSRKHSAKDENLSVLERARKQNRYHQNQDYNNQINKHHHVHHNTFFDAVHPEEFVAPNVRRSRSAFEKQLQQKFKLRAPSEETRKKFSSLADEIYHLNPLMFPQQQQQQQQSQDDEQHQQQHFFHRYPHHQPSRRRSSSSNSSSISLLSLLHQNPKPSQPEESSFSRNIPLAAKTQHDGSEQKHSSSATTETKHENHQPKSIPPPPPLPLTTNFLEAPRYGIDQDFFNVLSHFSTSAFLNHESEENPQKVETKDAEKKGQSPFRCFGEGLGTNHLLEPSARRCGVRRGHHHNHQNDEKNENNNKSFFVSSFLRKFNNSNNDSENHHEDQASFPFQNHGDTDVAFVTSKYNSKMNDFPCRKCSRCGQCTFHATLCLSDRSPHNHLHQQQHSCSSSSTIFCIIEPSPFLIEKVLKNVYSSSSSDYSSPFSVSLAELHSTLVSLVLEIGVENPVFSQFDRQGQENQKQREMASSSSSSTATTILQQIQDAKIIVAQLFEASGLTALLLSFLSSLKWLGLFSSNDFSSADLFASDILFDFSRKSSWKNNDRTFVEINWWPKISSRNNSVDGFQKQNSENLSTVLELLLLQGFFESDDDTSSSSISWDFISKRFVIFSDAEENEEKSIFGIDHFSNRTWFMKMKSEIASSIVCCVMQNLLLNKNGGQKLIL